MTITAADTLRTQDLLHERDMLTAATVTQEMIQNLSILADQRGQDGWFALCAKASNGDRAARKAIADLLNHWASRRGR